VFQEVRGVVLLVVNRELLISVMSGEFECSTDKLLLEANTSNVVHSRLLFKATWWDNDFNKLPVKERRIKIVDFFNSNPATEEWLSREVTNNGTEGLTLLSKALHEVFAM
jgi:hypothetical protein